MKPFRDGISAGDCVNVLEDARDGLIEADSAGLDGLQVQLLLHCRVQPLRRRLRRCRLLLLLLRLILNSLHGRHRRLREREMKLI